MDEKTVLAIDPGTAKCGMALVSRDADGHLDLVWRTIVPTENIEGGLEESAQVKPFSMIIIGGGTGSKAVVARVQSAMPSKGVLIVNEKDTSLQARERYWEHNKRRGWRRFWPATLQTPLEPVDDFAAMILAERVLNE